MCVSMTDPGSPETAREHLGPAQQLQGLGVVRSVCPQQKLRTPARTVKPAPCLFWNSGVADRDPQYRHRPVHSTTTQKVV